MITLISGQIRGESNTVDWDKPRGFAGEIVCSSRKCFGSVGFSWVKLQTGDLGGLRILDSRYRVLSFVISTTQGGPRGNLTSCVPTHVPAEVVDCEATNYPTRFYWALSP